MGRKGNSTKDAAVRKPRPRRRAEPRSKGLAASERQERIDPALDALIDRIELRGGMVLGRYRDPLGGFPTLLAALPIDTVQPTPFQRDLSEGHAKRMTDTIGKLGRYLDPIIVVPGEETFWTPNGRHRLEAMARLGARAIVALVLPDHAIQYKILALNTEKAHNLREKALEVIRMYRALAQVEDRREEEHVLVFEEPAFATLGICYERAARFAGGVYHPVLRRVDAWIDKPLSEALAVREARAAEVEELDRRVSELVEGLRSRGFRSPYLKSFVLARINPLRFMKAAPAFDEAFASILKRASRFEVEKVRQEDIAASAAPLAEDA